LPLTRAAPALLGVLGWPLDFTLSPEIHHAAFRAADLDWMYLAWPVPPASLGAAVSGLRVLGAIGANVTMPHKSTVIPFVDELGEDARAVGAVNTLQFATAGVVGHNTDVAGFAEFLAGDAGFEAAGRTALVLGAGGAARAVVRALEGLGAESIVVAARDEDQAALVAEISAVASPRAWGDAEEIVPAVDLVVNATSLGAAGEEALPGASFHSGQTVVDLIYNPPSTRLVETARASGASAWGGLGMLLRQAAASYRIWTGQPAPLEAMSAAAIRAIGLHALQGRPPIDRGR
jgi:shikimate dehydrogenase